MELQLPNSVARGCNLQVASGFDMSAATESSSIDSVGNNIDSSGGMLDPTKIRFR
jgi:hypothetical protein